ncbi:MAG: two component system transcriptional regulator, LuxR family [Gammaproteobacteria bacterium]|jgi:DNA-binding NarL/FixJ family response regulator|nr:two component system transcriptional regulator, LuxR family [Gammaproteobacteria bacterium]
MAVPFIALQSTKFNNQCPNPRALCVLVDMGFTMHVIADREWLHLTEWQSCAKSASDPASGQRASPKSVFIRSSTASLKEPLGGRIERERQLKFDRKPKLRIVLVQEHEVLRHGLEILVGQDAEFSVIASFDNISDALLSIPKLQPDLLLTDWELAGQTAWELLAEIRRLVPDCKTLILAAVDSQACVRAALQAGANGFIGLLADVSELTSGIRAVAAGCQFICHSTATRILAAHFSDNRPAAVPAIAQSITEREREVLTRIALGNSNKVIARELGVSPKTVEKHRSNMMRKLQLHNAAAITMYAIRNGMTVGDPFGSEPLGLASGVS